MPRAPLRPPVHALLAVLALAAVLAPGSLAVAQGPSVAGALTGQFVLADGDLGGGAMVDVWARVDWLRVGGFLGVSSISSLRDSHNRIAMPIGASVAAVVDTGLVEIQLRARGGLWGGATQDVKLTFGGFVGGGAYLMFDLGGGASLGAGLDAWGILGQGETWTIVPGVSLSWGGQDDPTALAADVGATPR